MLRESLSRLAACRFAPDAKPQAAQELIRAEPCFGSDVGVEYTPHPDEGLSMATASFHRLVRQLRHSAEATSLGELPDQDLLDRLLTGDTLAFEALVWRHGGLVLSACRRVLADEAAAEDA